MIRVMILATAMPATTPMTPPTSDMVADSMRNCSRMSLPARAEGFAYADFAGALGDGDQHDVHDDDAADDQRDAGDGRDDGAEAIQDLAQQILKGGAGIDGESVGRAGRQMAARAHDGAQLVR